MLLLVNKHAMESLGTINGSQWKLFFPAEPPVITPTFGVVEGPPRSTVALHCVVTGRPGPSILWLRNGTEIHRDGHYSPLHNGTLLVYNVRKGKDEGEYVCRAMNGAGVAEITIIVDVL